MSDALINQPIEAGIIRVCGCEDSCPCQLVHVLLLQADNEPIAHIPLDPAAARMLAKDLLNNADAAELRHLKNKGRLA